MTCEIYWTTQNESFVCWALGMYSTLHVPGIEMGSAWDPEQTPPKIWETSLCLPHRWYFSSSYVLFDSTHAVIEGIAWFHLTFSTFWYLPLSFVPAEHIDLDNPKYEFKVKSIKCFYKPLIALQSKTSKQGWTWTYDIERKGQINHFISEWKCCLRMDRNKWYKTWM